MHERALLGPRPIPDAGHRGGDLRVGEHRRDVVDVGHPDRFQPQPFGERRKRYHHNCMITH
jgi:hypothetical protein